MRRKAVKMMRRMIPAMKVLKKQMEMMSPQQAAVSIQQRQILRGQQFRLRSKVRSMLGVKRRSSPVQPRIQSRTWMWMGEIQGRGWTVENPYRLLMVGWKKP